MSSIPLQVDSLLDAGFPEEVMASCDTLIEAESLEQSA